ncbi:hypothetical protein FDUTEX481_06199 [Tolypothrix sp. PCC 7601]|nr:hypothetical protein FDUTEX481_06199 [Tolypothrix sp. PCC 7601]
MQYKNILVFIWSIKYLQLRLFKLVNNFNLLIYQMDDLISVIVMLY